MKNFVLGILSAYVVNDVIKRVFASKHKGSKTDEFKSAGQFSGVSSTPSENVNNGTFGAKFGAKPYKAK